LQRDKVGDLMANNLLMLIKLDTDTMTFASLLVSIIGAVAAIFAAFYANIAAFYAKKAATKRDLTRVDQNTQQVGHFSNKILSIDTQIQPQAQREASQAQPQQETPQLQVQREASQAQPQQETPQLQVQREASEAQTQQEAPQLQVQREASEAQTQQEAPQLQAQREASEAQTQQEAPQLQVQREASEAQTQQETPQLQAQHISISVEGDALGEVPLELFLTLQDSSIRVSRVETLNEVGKTLSSSPSKATDNALVFKSILTPKKLRQWWSAGESTSEGGGRSVLRVYLLVDESRREVYRDIPVSIVDELRSVGIASMVVWTIKGSI
jgi:hypothetical protein